MARLDVVGVVTLGIITALGGGTIRDVLIDSLPRATFSDWRFLAVAAGGGWSPSPSAAGWSGCTGRSPCWTRPVSAWSPSQATIKAQTFGLGPAQAVILGAVPSTPISYVLPASLYGQDVASHYAQAWIGKHRYHPVTLTRAGRLPFYFCSGYDFRTASGRTVDDDIAGVGCR